jgi:hypothetical protein
MNQIGLKGEKKKPKKKIVAKQDEVDEGVLDLIKGGEGDGDGDVGVEGEDVDNQQQQQQQQGVTYSLGDTQIELPPESSQPTPSTAESVVLENPEVPPEVASTFTTGSASEPTPTTLPSESAISVLQVPTEEEKKEEESASNEGTKSISVDF